MSAMQVRVGSRAARFTSDAVFFEGARAVPETVTVWVDEADQALVWQDKDETKHRWPLDQIREVPDQAGKDLLVLRLRDDPVQRLILPDRGLEPRLHYRTRRAPVTRRGRLIVWAIAAIASVALIIGVLVPRMADQLAVFIPPEGERALGEATLEQIRSALDETGFAPIPLCTQPAGQNALQTITKRLTAGMDLDQPPTVHVLDHQMVNAFALPGGYVVLFRGLINAAETPEQVAAVLAHELGHVVSRDPTRHALRSAGSIGVLGLLFGDFAGGALVLFLTERLIDAHYSQGAEAAADAFAHEVMLGANLRPDALAEMFEILKSRGGQADGLIAHFLSHPEMGDRIEAARAATPSDLQAVPLLSEADWRLLQQICD